ncbi:transcription antitermination factor NusB, partial [Acinetobacter baumannii]
ALYQYDLNEQSIDRIIGEFVTQHLGKEIDGVEYKDADAEFFADLARQTVKQRDAIDEQLAAAISVRDADRVETLLRAIMR